MFLIAGIVALVGAAAVLRIPARQRGAAGAAARQPVAGAPAPAPAAGTTTTGST